MWLLWAVAAAATVQLAPNPLYVALVIAITALVVEAHADDGPLAGAFPVILTAGLVFAALRVVLTVATTHGGAADEVLFRLPEATLPGILGGFTVGGTVEGPVIARAAAEGWALVGVLAAFAAFNAVVSHYELVQAAPRAFYEVGLAVTVALAFVPSTVEAVGAVREADRARTGGRVVRRGRLLRQVVPILETGMERAVHLAESMDSRGFGHQTGHLRRRGRGVARARVAPLPSAAASWPSSPAPRRPRPPSPSSGWPASSPPSPSPPAPPGRIRYRRRHLRLADWRIVARRLASRRSSSVALALADDATLLWPGPIVGAPGINLLAVAAISTLAIPASRTTAS